MKSNVRIINLIQFLLNHPHASIKEIEFELGFSEEVVRYELDNLNDYLEILNIGYIKKSSTGRIKADIKDGERLIDNIMAVYKLSRDERIEYLAFKMIHDGTVNITHEMKILGLSRNTIKSDLKYVVDDLNKYGIRSFGWNLSENCEELKRSYLFNHYKNHYLILLDNDDEMLLVSEVSKIIASDFKKCDINQITVLVNEMIKETGNEILYDTFLLYTIIMIQRNILGYKITEYNEYFDNNLHFSEKIKTKFEVLFNKLELTLENVELIKLTNVLSGFNDSYPNDLYDDNIVKANIFVINLINYVAETINLDFKDDEILLEGLFEHTKATIYRLKHGFKSPTETYYHAIEQYQDIFKIVAQGLIELEEMMREKLSQEEIALYVVHFLGAIRRLEESQPQLTQSVLICNSGYGTSVLLRNILEANYHIQVQDSLSLYQLRNYDYDKVDIAITTIELDYQLRKSLPVPVLYISPFLNFEDTQILKKFGIERKKNNQTPSINEILNIVESSAVVLDSERLKSDLKALLSNKYVTSTQTKSLFDNLTEDDIYLIKGSINWQQMLEIGGRHLINKGIVKQTYVEEVFKTIDTYGSHFILKNKIAIPHARVDAGVNGSGMAVVYTTEDVIFDNGLAVRLLLFIAATEKPCLLSTVMKTKELTENTNLYQEIEAMNKEALKEYLRR